MPPVAVAVLDRVGGPVPPGGIILPGSQTLAYVESSQIAVAGALAAPHGGGPHAAARALQGSPLTRIDGIPILRQGDRATCLHRIQPGRSWVVDDSPGPGGVGPPAEPSNLAVTVGVATASFAWDLLVSDPPIDAWQERVDGGPWTDIPGSGPGTTSVVVGGLSPDSEHTVDIRAVNPLGPGRPVSIAFRTLPPGIFETLADGAQASDAVAPDLSRRGFASLADSARASDGLVHAIDLADGASAADARARGFEARRALAETAVAGDGRHFGFLGAGAGFGQAPFFFAARSVSRGLSVSAADSAEASDATLAEASRSHAVPLADRADVQDQLEGFAGMTLAAALDDAAEASAAVLRGLAARRSAADSAQVSDGLVHAIDLADGASAADAASRGTETERTLAETAGAGDRPFGFAGAGAGFDQAPFFFGAFSSRGVSASAADSADVQDELEAEEATVHAALLDDAALAGDGLVYAIDLADGASAGDALAGVRGRLGSAADSAFFADALAGVRGRLGSAADSAEASDALAALHGRAAAAADGASAGDALAALHGRAAAAADSAEASDALSRRFEARRTLAETLAAGDRPFGFAGAGAGFDQAHFRAEHPSALTRRSSFADSIVSEDDLEAAIRRAHAADLDDAAQVSDGLAQAVEIADGASGSDALSRRTETERTLAESAAAADSLEAVRGRTPSAVDSAEASDALSRRTETERTLAESAAAADSLEALLGRGGALSERALAQDAVSRRFEARRTLAETAGADDVGHFGFAGNGTGFDRAPFYHPPASRGVRAQLADSAVGEDDLAAGFSRGFSAALDEAAAAADALVGALRASRSFADGVRTADAASGVRGRRGSSADGARAGDALEAVRGRFGSAADSASASEALASALSRALTGSVVDSAAAADALEAALGSGGAEHFGFAGNGLGFDQAPFHHPPPTIEALADSVRAADALTFELQEASGEIGLDSLPQGTGEIMRFVLTRGGSAATWTSGGSLTGDYNPGQGGITSIESSSGVRRLTLRAANIRNLVGGRSLFLLSDAGSVEMPASAIYGGGNNRVFYAAVAGFDALRTAFGEGDRMLFVMADAGSITL